MSDQEHDLTMEDWEIPEDIYGEEQAVEIVGDTMDTLLATADVARVYGVPVEKNGAVVIPAAEILAFAAFGVGYGYGPGKQEEACCESCAAEASEEQDEDADEDEDEYEDDLAPATNSGGGGGGGGGGKTFSRPVAVVAISPEGQVSVQPVVDPTKIVLAALVAGGSIVATLVGLLKPRR